jgi:hypothetical protein
MRQVVIGGSDIRTRCTAPRLRELDSAGEVDRPA